MIGSRIRTSRLWVTASCVLAVLALLLGGMSLVGTSASAHAGAVVASPAGTVVMLVPNRIGDSRIFESYPSFTAMEEQDLQVAGRGGVPLTGVAAVVLNVTVVNPQTHGFLTVWPVDVGRPNTSNVNFDAHQTIANSIIVKLSSDGTIALFNGSGGGADVLVDVEGYIPA